MNVKAVLILAVLTALCVLLCLNSLSGPADDDFTPTEKSFDHKLTLPSPR